MSAPVLGHDGLTPRAEARLFRRLRWNVLRNLFSSALSSTRLRLTVITSLSLLFWVGLLCVFLDAFRFLTASVQHIPTRTETIHVIFGLFFAALLGMFVFSSGVILYSFLYRSRETEFLLRMPIRVERVFVHKFQEAVLLSSWGFVLLGSPMLVAYGVVVDAPWYYFLMLAPFALAFVMVPCAVGAILCLLIVHYLPRHRMLLLLIGCAIAAALAAFLTWRVFHGSTGDAFTTVWFRDVLSRLRFGQQRLLPSWWFSAGLLEASYTGDDQAAHAIESFLFLALLAANAMMGLMLAVTYARRVLRESYSSVHSSKSFRRRVGGSWMDATVMGLSGMLPVPIRLMLVKDLRLFRRDVVQWSQFVVFFGLLALYFFNIRPLMYEMNEPQWVHLISFLNLAVVGLLLAAFTSRFVYPLMSLEGRRFWILARLPMRRSTIVWSKFLFATFACMVPCFLLVMISDLMLDIVPIVQFAHLLDCVLLCTGLAGIAVGLGARVPNMSSESPARIAAGFGGTLTLLLSAFYIISIVLLSAVPCYFYFTPPRPDAAFPLGEFGRWLELGTRTAIIKGMAACALIAVVATSIPLYLGIRAFRRMEF